MPPVALTHMQGPDGVKDNPSGLTQKYYVGLVPFMTTIGDINRNPASASENAELVEISTDHVFDVNEGFIEVYATQNTGKLTSESAGETDGKTMMNKLEGFYPGDDIESSANVKLMKNNRLIILAEELDGTIKQIGSAKIYATLVSFSKTTGTIDGSEVRGFKLEFSHYDLWEMFYTGVITVKA